MSERAPKFEQQTERLEHEHRIEAVSHNHEKAEAAPVLSTSEALKNVAEASHEDQSEKIMDKLETAQDEQPAMSRGDVSRGARAIAKKRGLKQIRDQESMPEKTLSKIIHQPFIRAVSEGTGKTVTRPSGMLGGGLVAFIGSGSYLILAKSLDFSYNASVSLALFVGGFFLGIALELMVHLATASHRQVD